MACMILKSDVLSVAPQLSTLPETAWVMILLFLNDFDISCDPSLRKLALSLLGAHLGEVAGTTGASGTSGAVISETAGGLKRTYAQPTTSAATSDLSRTTYGQQYLALLQMSIGTKGPRLI